MTAANLNDLSPQHCLNLMRAHPVQIGRLGVTDADGHPLIIPVNYCMDDDRVVLRVAPDSIVAQRAIERRVAFEVDDVDVAWQEGWSVLIQGTAQRVTDVSELARLRRLRLRPWAPGDRSLYLRIEADLVTGRQIV